MGFAFDRSPMPFLTAVRLRQTKGRAMSNAGTSAEFTGEPAARMLAERRQCRGGPRAERKRSPRSSPREVGDSHCQTAIRRPWTDKRGRTLERPGREQRSLPREESGTRSESGPPEGFTGSASPTYGPRRPKAAETSRVECRHRAVTVDRAPAAPPAPEPNAVPLSRRRTRRAEPGSALSRRAIVIPDAPAPNSLSRLPAPPICRTPKRSAGPVVRHR